MFIKVLQANYGDSFLIRYYGSDNKFHNILIDSGLKRTYEKVLKKELALISDQKERVDLIIITHIDQDHIGGLLKLISKDKYFHLVDKVWFNSSLIISSFLKTLSNVSHEVPIESNSNNASIRQGKTLEDYLSKTTKWHQKPIYAPGSFEFFGLKIHILSPTQKELEKLNNKWETELEDKTTKKLSSKGNDYHLSIPNLINSTFQKDTSIANASSLAFLVEYKNKCILFAGDAHPNVIFKSLEDGFLNHDGKFKVNFWKLSHHGSKKSTNKKLINLIECSNFIISTNGSRYHLPNKEILAKILCNPNRSDSDKYKFFFNYDNSKLRSIFSDSEMNEYNFECIFPNKNLTIILDENTTTT